MVTLQELEERLVALESRVATLETCFSNIERQVDNFGNYKDRTADELLLIERQLDIMIETLDLIINDQANQSDRARAKALRTRLKKNKTRAQNARSE